MKLLSFINNFVYILCQQMAYTVKYMNQKNAENDSRLGNHSIFVLLSFRNSPIFVPKNNDLLKVCSGHSHNVFLAYHQKSHSNLYHEFFKNS